MQKRAKQYIGLLTAVVGLGSLVFFILPVIQKVLVPAQYLEIIENQDIDPTSLFYSESEASFEIYYERIIADE